MTEDQTQQAHHEIARATQARQIVEDPIFREAADGLKSQLMEQWEQSPARDTEGRERLWLAVSLLGKLEAHLLQVMQTGKMAQFQLKEARTLLDRMVRR